MVPVVALTLLDDINVAYNQPRYLDFLKPPVGFRRKTKSNVELRPVAQRPSDSLLI